MNHHLSHPTYRFETGYQKFQLAFLLLEKEKLTTKTDQSTLDSEWTH